MKKLLLTLILLMSFGSLLYAQTYHQYFDGADTSLFNSVFVDIDTAHGNVWQIGRPQKVIFDSAATYPNVIVTDTVNPYPVNDSSSFIVRFHPAYSWGIFAFQWKQKLDIEYLSDGGIVEFSVDTGNTWFNIFNNPYVYNLYGFDSSNIDTLISGEFGFTGTDSIWRDVWLCFDYSFLSLTDSLMFRFTLKSDSVDSVREGWMIDNMMMHITMVHGLVVDPSLNKDIRVFPTVTTGIVHIEAKKVQKYHIIEEMQLVNMQGRVVKRFTNVPVKFYIDVSDQPNGTYYLRVKTNLYSDVFPVIISR